MNCKNCGSLLQAGVNACHNCGTSTLEEIKPEGTPEATPVTPEPVATLEAATPPVVEPVPEPVVTEPVVEPAPEVAPEPVLEVVNPLPPAQEAVPVAEQPAPVEAVPTAEPVAEVTQESAPANPEPVATPEATTTPVAEATPEVDISASQPVATTPESAPEPEKKKSNAKTIILIIIAVLGLGAIGYQYWGRDFIQNFLQQEPGEPEEPNDPEEPEDPEEPNDPDNDLPENPGEFDFNNMTQGEFNGINYFISAGWTNIGSVENRVYSFRDNKSTLTMSVDSEITTLDEEMARIRAISNVVNETEFNAGVSWHHVTTEVSEGFYKEIYFVVSEEGVSRLEFKISNNHNEAWKNYINQHIETILLFTTISQ